MHHLFNFFSFDPKNPNCDVLLDLIIHMMTVEYYSHVCFTQKRVKRLPQGGPGRRRHPYTDRVGQKSEVMRRNLFVKSLDDISQESP